MSLKHKNIAIARSTFYDRSAMLQLSLDYQKAADHSDKFTTYIFVDPHPKYGYMDSYDDVINNEYIRVNWQINKGKYNWYDSIKYIFNNTDYEYIISIEDDVLISKDYLRLCEQLALYDETLTKDDNILYFHIGAWEEPKNNPNKIIKSQASSRSILINRKKFQIIESFVHEQPDIIDNDHMITDILNKYNMITIAPETNRHGHIGIYGWSANHINANMNGQKSIFDRSLSHYELYDLLKANCLSGENLRKLNQNKNPDYFWNFNPNINFTQLEYSIC